MSKGGAGKVYFVLYLAVILELLIIIVERDEAEEHLIRKQKEAEEIVEAVMAQLNTGSGSSGVNALPQDEITLLKDDALRNVAEKDKPKMERSYQIRVSTVRVKDVIGDNLPDDIVKKKRRISEIIRLFNVMSLEVVDSLKQRTDYLTLDSVWIQQTTDKIVQKIGEKKKISDVIEYKDGLRFLKEITPDSTNYLSTTEMGVFRFSPSLTFAEGEAVADKSQFSDGIKVFEYNFKPSGPGLYKITLKSKTNNIIGVSGLKAANDESEEDVVSIGTIQLTRRQLSKVESRLRAVLGSEIETLCDAFQTKKFNFAEFSAKFKAALANVKPEDLDLSESDKIRRGELLKNITVLLHGDANQMEQNNPMFQFEINVKEPKIATPDPCIADLLKSQRVLSGVNKIVIPLTVNNFRNEVPQVTITPNDATVKVVAMGSGTGGSGGMRNQPYEIHIEGASASGERKDYTVKITNLKMCDDTEPIATISVFPGELANRLSLENILEKRVTIGKALRLAIQPSSSGDIPSNQFKLSYTLDGQENTITGTNPLMITVPCIPKNLSSLRVLVKWVYRPTPQYVEEVVVFDRTVGKAKQGAPEILLSNTSESFEPKPLKYVLSGIAIEPPPVDCPMVKAQEKDVKVDYKLLESSVGKYQVTGSIDPMGESLGLYQYRLSLQLKGPRTKFDGGNIVVTITASVGGVSTTETKTVTIPPFR